MNTGYRTCRQGATLVHCIIDDWSVATGEWLEKAELKYIIAVLKFLINYTCIMFIHHIYTWRGGITQLVMGTELVRILSLP